MAKKKGINALQRLMNVGFIAWILWMALVLHYWVLDEVTDSIGYWHEVLKFAVIGIVFPVANYIFFKKITFWNKGS